MSEAVPFDGWMAGAFVAYLGVVLLIGVIAAGLNRSLADYFLANRTLGAWVAAISSTASSESGWVTLGAVGMAYFYGFSAIWFVPGCLLGYVFNWFFVAERLRKRSRELDSLTLPDFLEDHFKDGSRLLRVVSVGIIFFCLGNYVAAQFVAAGKMFHASFGTDYVWGVLLGAAITVGYTLMGGFRAVAWTDLLQGMLMVFGLVLLPVWAFCVMGGPAEVFDRLDDRATGSDRLEIVAGGERTVVPLADGRSVGAAGGAVFARDAGGGWRVASLPEGARVNDVPPRGEFLSQDDEIVFPGGKATFRTANDYFAFGRNLPAPFAFGLALGLLGIGLGYPGQPHLHVRYMGLASKRDMRRARVIALVWGVLVYYGATFLGFAARAYVPALADPETAYMHLAKELLHPLLAGVLIAAVFAAIGSTADSQLLVCASSFARDIYHKILRRDADEKTLLRISQATVLVIGAAAAALAAAEVKEIFGFVLYAWSGLGAAFGPVVLLALYAKRCTRTGALASVVTGFVSLIVLYNVVKNLWGPTVPAYAALFPAFFLAFAAGLAGSVFSRDEKREA